MIKVYIADPNTEDRMKLHQYFSIQGFSTESFGNLGELAMSFQQFLPDILIMELNFPDGDGFQFLRKLNALYSFPIIVTSECDSESDRIMSFELGCDDFLSKPYSRKELLLRVIAILRHKEGRNKLSSQWVLHSSVLSVDWNMHSVSLNNREIDFTVSEWKIFQYFLKNPGRLISRNELLHSCFSENMESYDRIIDTHIKNIRAKLGIEGADWIETIRGYGYRFTGTSARHNGFLERHQEENTNDDR